MGIRRHDAKRDANEAGIANAFLQLGCLVVRIDTPCDLLVLTPHSKQVLLVEVKTKTGRLTDLQKEFASLWPMHVVRSVDDAIALITGRKSA